MTQVAMLEHDSAKWMVQLTKVKVHGSQDDFGPGWYGNALQRWELNSLLQAALIVNRIKGLPGRVPTRAAAFCEVATDPLSWSRRILLRRKMRIGRYTAFTLGRVCNEWLERFFSNIAVTQNFIYNGIIRVIMQKDEFAFRMQKGLELDWKMAWQIWTERLLQ